MVMSTARSILGVALLSWTPLLLAQSASPLPAETQLVASASAAPATQETFTIASAEDLTITLTDLGNSANPVLPPPLASASVILTQGGVIVGNDPPASGTASLSGGGASTATLKVAGAVGRYSLYVIATPGSGASFGTFSICVAPSSNPTQCISTPPDSFTGNNMGSVGISFTASASLPAASSPALSTFTYNFTVPSTGMYTVTYTDDQFPVALSNAPALGVAIFAGSSAVGPTPIPSGTPVSLTAGTTYTLLAVAQADPTALAGLFGVIIQSGAAAPALSQTFAVGKLAPAATVTNPSAQALTLSLTDYGFPNTLATAAGIVTAGGQALGAPASLTAPLQITSAPAGALKVWTYATAGANGPGSYEFDLNPSSGAALLSTAAAVNGGTGVAYAFATSSQPTGSYKVVATDYNFPTTLPNLQFAVGQAGALLAPATAQGVPVTVTTKVAGPLFVLTTATPPANANGLFDVNVMTAAASTVLDQTQAVGTTSTLFNTQTLSVESALQYDVNLTDQMYPAAFTNLAAIVTSGPTVLGEIIGAGIFKFNGSPGTTYQLSLVATPGANQQYGLYGVGVVPSAPTVVLTASPTTVSTGSMTTLSWTTANATTCTGSGSGFAGNQSPGPGTVTASVTVTATTTYQLSCTGPGGSASSSATVKANAGSASGSNGGGGGAFDSISLGLLALLSMFRRTRRTAPGGWN